MASSFFDRPVTWRNVALLVLVLGAQLALLHVLEPWFAGPGRGVERALNWGVGAAFALAGIGLLWRAWRPDSAVARWYLAAWAMGVVAVVATLREWGPDAYPAAGAFLLSALCVWRAYRTERLRAPGSPRAGV